MKATGMSQGKYPVIARLFERINHISEDQLILLLKELLKEKFSSHLFKLIVDMSDEQQAALLRHLQKKDDALNKQIDEFMDKIYREKYWNADGGDKKRIAQLQNIYEELVQEETDTFFDSSPAISIPGQLLYLTQRLQDKTGVKMIDKTLFFVDGIEPGSVGLLSLQDEIQISLSCFQIPCICELRPCRSQ